MTLIIDPQIAGISGDMILCSLVDLGANQTKIINGVSTAQKFLTGSKINKIEFVKVTKQGTSATKLVLDITESTDERTGEEIKQAIVALSNEINLSDTAKRFSISCIDTLIAAESKIHNQPVNSVHFHEASSVDTIIDIVGTAIALDDLHLFNEEIISMPVAVGGGHVTFSHGTMSNPASAILEIFKNSNITICGGPIDTELSTPTGSAILTNIAKKYLTYYPPIRIESIGYGAGEKDFEQFSNVLKIVKGKSNNTASDTIQVLETNVDDVSGEILGELVDRIMKKGAKDISIYPGMSKKGRPTNLITILCDYDHLDDILHVLITETGTLGVRIRSSERIVLPRESHTKKIKLNNQEFTVHYKASKYQEHNFFKIEFDDIKIISLVLNKSIKETENLLKEQINRDKNE